MRSFDFSKILGKLAATSKKIVWSLGLYAFWVILFLILIDFVLGGIVFYKYVFLAENEEPGGAKNVIKFDETTYQEVLKELELKNQ